MGSHRALRSRWLRACAASFAATALAGASVDCGVGAVGRSIRPAAPTAWEITGETRECRTVSDHGEPLIVDWPAYTRGNMEEAMADGVAVVAYDCHSLRLLEGCHIEGGYGFMPMSKKEETIRLENADEVATNLPTFGLSLLQGLHGELSADTTIDLAIILIGKQRTTLGEATTDRLVGGRACEGATHFVRGAFIGAFAMGTGTRGNASLGSGLFSAKSSSSKLVGYRDGDPGHCRQVDATSSSAPDACKALVRLELVALKTPAGSEDAVDPTCPRGLVLADGKCVRPTEDRAHECKPDDLEDCKTQCAKHDATSCFNLGVIYDSGRLAAVDLARAFSLFEQACDAGNMKGCNGLGVLYSKGSGVARDETRAAELYERACKGGVPAACSNLGYYYEHGDGGAPDPLRAVALYRNACNGGDGAGCANLGFLYDHGTGVPKDARQAFAFYQRACDGGERKGCGHLGFLYENGRGVPKDVARAAALFEKACEAGDDFFCVNLGFVYADGRGVRKDLAHAAALYKRACDADVAYGCVALGRAYAAGEGVAAEPLRAAALYAQACDAGDGEGCGLLGLAYAHARGVPKDLAKAAALYERSCHAGEMGLGCLNFGEALADGEGVAKDVPQAVALFKQVCDSGADAGPWGCNNLALMYEKGVGVPADRAKAVRLYRAGCAQDSWACDQLKRLRVSSR